jgi:hypothetical protein
VDGQILFRSSRQRDCEQEVSDPHIRVVKLVGDLCGLSPERRGGPVLRRSAGSFAAWIA